MYDGIFDITGSTVGLTGGGGHLGRELSLGLAAAGALVYICGRNNDRLRQVAEESRKRRLPGRVLYQPLDLGDENALKGFLDHILREQGSVSGWVNNAASGTAEPQGEMTRSGINHTLDMSLTQVMLCTQEAGYRMAASGGGSIVNISSMYGLVSPQPELYSEHPQYHNPPAYGAAKAGVIQYTRYAACHLARNAVRVNCITPGAFPSVEIQQDKGFVRELKNRVPLGKTGTPRDLVGPLIFLLSAASAYITGHNLVVDGGWTAW